MKFTRFNYILFLTLAIAMVLGSFYCAFAFKLFPGYIDHLDIPVDEKAETFSILWGIAAAIFFIASFILYWEYRTERRSLSMMEEREKEEDASSSSFVPVSPRRVFPPSNPLPLELTELDRYIGKKLKAVEYALINRLEEKHVFNKHHYCDVAVTIQFEDDSWLNWLWEEPG